MSTEPSAATPDSKASADSAEFEDFFVQGARAAHEDDRVLAEREQQAEDFDAPLITPAQLARRARLRRAVGLLVTGLGVAFLVLFANRGLQGPARNERLEAKDESARVPVKAVVTLLGAARPQARTSQASVPVATATTAPGSREPGRAESLLAPPLAARSSGRVTPVVHRASGARALAPVPAAESLRRPAAASALRPRAASAPVRGTPAARASGDAEPPPTASFPVDLQ